MLEFVPLVDVGKIGPFTYRDHRDRDAVNHPHQVNDQYILGIYNDKSGNNEKKQRSQVGEVTAKAVEQATDK
ncbi:hypothetical protein GCM10022246_17640 [Pedobacter ginsengiterrae]|uniref:Uncharacterized protein n=1 Tax=Pedobacter ginsengiterrae TaxID=871696 RepID=A0ABP7PG47_9SPHI